MPSIGHAIVGLAAGRWYARAGGPRAAAAAVFLALATFQDLDVLARGLGAPAGSAWLHRGGLHALTTALLAGLAAAALAGGLGRTRAAMALAGALVAVSHGLLDTLTGGGAGVMLAWPITRERVLAPWSALPAAPMGLRLLSSRGAAVALREVVLFAPLLAYLAWPARTVSAPGPRTSCAPSRGGGAATPPRAAP